MGQARKNAAIAQSLLDKYNTKKQSALADTRTAVGDALANKGLSLDAYSKDYDAVINNILQQYPQLDAPSPQTTVQVSRAGSDPQRYNALLAKGKGHAAQAYRPTKTVQVPFRDLASYQNLPDMRQVLNSDQITQALLDRVNSRTRDNLSSQVTNWTNANPLNSLLSDTADDPIIENIIGTQYKTASSQLDNALKRGVLTQGAYSNATNALNNQRSAANARLQSIGQGVLTQGRQTLQNDIDKTMSQANNWQVGSNFDLSKALGNVTNDANTQRGLLEGNIRSALGNNTNFFDVNSAMNTGTSLARTGGTNPIISQIGENGGLADALAQRQQRGQGSYAMTPQQRTQRSQQDALL